MTPTGRLALLAVLVAGFLTMHGFLAVSAGADADSPTSAMSVVSIMSAEDEHAADHASDRSGAPVPSPHSGDHHDLLVGCMVALVGIAVLVLAHLLSRRRPLGAGRPPLRLPRVLRWVGDHAPALPPPRIALCVDRV